MGSISYQDGRIRKAQMNDKIYIHEYIDIIGHSRDKYMYHMAANFSPIGQEERNQSCYGIWGVVGSTGYWPQVVNIWEEEGISGLAASFRHELQHETLQDPKLAKWWATAAQFRSGGRDRLLLPAPWTPTSAELCAAGVTGDVYAQEEVCVAPGKAGEYLLEVREIAAPLYERFGWQLVGAWETLMTNDSEAFLLWAIPTWTQWAELEKALRTDPALSAWRAQSNELTTSFNRYLLVDAPLSPFRTGRQPRREDRTEQWVE